MRPKRGHAASVDEVVYLLANILDLRFKPMYLIGILNLTRRGNQRAAPRSVFAQVWYHSPLRLTWSTGLTRSND